MCACHKVACIRGLIQARYSSSAAAAVARDARLHAGEAGGGVCPDGPALAADVPRVAGLVRHALARALQRFERWPPGASRALKASVPVGPLACEAHAAQYLETHRAAVAGR
jgi:hypothetical protein